MQQNNVKENLQIVRDEINEACLKAGRSCNSVKLCAVSKFHPIEAVEEAIKSEQFLFGENRVQEAFEKFKQLKENNYNFNLHIIGSLQTNKVKKALEVASCIQSVDRIELLQEIEKQCCRFNNGQGRDIDILFEIHTGEDSKSGYTSKDELKKNLELLAEGNFPHIKCHGLMTMAPFTKDEILIHKSFSTLRELSIELAKDFPLLNFSQLSMGMSGDFKIAIEEGSTMVRIGTAIFGQRDYNK